MGHRWHAGLVGAVLAVLVAVPAGFVIGLGDGTEPAAPAVATTRPRSTSRHATVLLIGDSLVHQAAAGFEAALPDTTVVDGSVPGSGLLNGPADWAARAAELVDRYHPDVVVVSFVGNYDQSAGSLVPDTPAFDEAWSTAATRLTAQLRARAVRVDWVAQPPVAEPNFYRLPMARIEMVTALGRRLAAAPGVGFVDADDAVSGPAGSYTATRGVCGADVVVRILDGVHFSTAGAAWWGAQLAVAVARLEELRVLDPCSVLAALDPTLG